MMKLYKSTLAILLVIALNTSMAQTTHEVSVGNFFFEPATLTIQVGDIVRWTNQEGFHNVGTEVYPDNPNTFGNELSSSNWVYEFTFTEVGTNQYQCDAHPGPMQGTIIVEDNSLSINDQDGSAPFTVFPNPVVDKLTWKWDNRRMPSSAIFQLHDMTGKVVAEFSMLQFDSFDVSHLSGGLYYYRVDMGDGKIQSGKLLLYSN